MQNDLISRSALSAAVTSMNNNLSGVQMLIDNAPAVDAVPVVRCKDCAFYDFGECCNTTMDMSDGAHFYPYPTDFCSYGERKQGDTNG